MRFLDLAAELAGYVPIVLLSIVIAFVTGAALEMLLP